MVERQVVALLMSVQFRPRTPILRSCGVVVNTLPCQGREHGFNSRQDRHLTIKNTFDILLMLVAEKVNAIVPKGRSMESELCTHQFICMGKLARIESLAIPLGCKSLANIKKGGKYE